MTAKCDTCGKPYAEDVGIYTIASKFDDDGELVSFRHWDCHTPLDKVVDKLRESIKKAEQQLRNLR
jgi:hypothetical protein